MQIRYYHLDEVSSTKVWTKEHAHEFQQDALAVISATSQTDGRGRYERKWYSPAGKNLYLNLGFYLDAPALKPFALCQLTTLVLEELLKDHGITAKIKWPNDLLVNDKKIVGILTERYEVNGRLFMSIGIGLNINMTRDELINIPQKATSMLIEKSRPFAVDEVKEYCVRLFLKRFKEAKERGFDEVLRHWQKSLEWMLQQPVFVQTPERRLKGKVVALQSEGSLLVELPDGQTEEVSPIH